VKSGDSAKDNRQP